jgi:hypothetical protein
MSDPFTSIRDALLTAKSTTADISQDHVGGQLTNVSDANFGVGAWESHAPVEKHDAKKAYLGAAIQKADAMPTLTDEFFARVAAIRRRIPAPEVPMKQLYVPQMKQDGLSSGGGAKAASAAQSAFLTNTTKRTRDAFLEFRNDPTAANAKNFPKIRDYQEAERDYKKARDEFVNAEREYEEARERHSKELTVPAALHLFDALTTMRLKITALNRAEDKLAKVRAPYDAARIEHYKLLSYPSFINQEGNVDSISTADYNAFTWGIGFSNTDAGVPSLLRALFSNYPTYGMHGERTKIAQAVDDIRALLHIAGFVIQPAAAGGRYLYVDTENKTILNIDEGNTPRLRRVMGGMLATKDRTILHLLAWIGRDPDTLPAVIWAQMERRLAGYTSLGVLEGRIATWNLLGFAVKMKHAIVPYWAEGKILDWSWDSLKTEITRADDERRRRDANYDWESYELNLTSALITGADAQRPLAAHMKADDYRGGNLRRRRPEIEPPSPERDRQWADHMMRFLCHTHELSKLGTINQPLPTKGKPDTYVARPVGNASDAYTYFADAWFHQAGLRHWDEWLNAKKTTDPPDLWSFCGPYQGVVTDKAFFDDYDQSEKRKEAAPRDAAPREASRSPPQGHRGDRREARDARRRGEPDQEDKEEAAKGPGAEPRSG